MNFLKKLWRAYCDFTDRYFAGGQSCRRCVPQVNPEAQAQQSALSPKNTSNP